ncbi:MAG: hypothetical protein U9Q40_03715 [Campylobacterota bacterium]|nr:hypothetical protein [Campylobacterota bacterium]
MIKYIFLSLLLVSMLDASKILSYNIYDRTDRADVMITFDTPYEGVIKQSITRSKIVIKLSDASIESSKIKKVSSNFLHSVTIIPMSDHTQIVASVPSSVKLIASKTSDSYGLRLRFTDTASSAKNAVNTPQASGSDLLSSLPTKKSDDMSNSYYIVVTILIIGILVLFVLKKKMTLKNAQNTPSPWLFQENKSKNEPQTQNATPKTDINPQGNDISIRFQKSLNEENSVVMLDFAEQSYLILMGKSNILLDKFTDNKPNTQEDFESILKNRHQELDDFLRVDSNKSTASNDSKEALQAYKERAASILYEA